MCTFSNFQHGRLVIQELLPRSELAKQAGQALLQQGMGKAYQGHRLWRGMTQAPLFARCGAKGLITWFVHPTRRPSRSTVRLN